MENTPTMFQHRASLTHIATIILAQLAFCNPAGAEDKLLTEAVNFTGMITYLTAKVPGFLLVAVRNNETAIAGFGTVTLERWGRAMVVHVAHSSIQAPDFIAVLVTSAISASTGAAAFSTVLSKQDGVRVLIASRAAAERARKWLDEGVTWGDAVSRLQGGAS